MAFTELRSVGKIYVNEEKASVGIRGIDLSFERGEFVAITGQSGSGKTTLLNIISGMDSYEEGELLIDSQPTSHLTQSDWERVRERYISFIFQDYNIVDSFTVLKNVELALLGTPDKSERRRRALELIRRVGLEEHINSRGSQLSGGQKQRAVIARALAKNSPIILADEPTGNLDAATSKEIISLLHSVSEDKLVIVVTHDFAEVTEYATRHIRMFDGAVEFDKRLSEPRRKNAEGAVNPEDSAAKASQDTGAHAPINGTDAAPAEQAASDTPAAHHSESLHAALELGLARFTSMPRLSVMISAAILSSALILTLVLSLLTPVILFFSYAENHTFLQYDGRVVICRKDGATLSESELSELAGSLEAENTVRYDFILDGWLRSESTDGSSRSFEIASPAESYTPDYGRLPETAGEIMLRLPIGDIEWYGKLEDGDMVLEGCFDGRLDYRVTGIDYYYDNTVEASAVLTPEGVELASLLSYFLARSSTKDMSMQFEVTGDGVPRSARKVVHSSSIFMSFDIPVDRFYLKDTAFVSCINSSESAVTSGNIYFSKINDSAHIDGPISVYQIEMEDISFTSELPEGVEHRLRLLESTVAISPYTIAKTLKDDCFSELYTQASLFFKNNRQAERAAEQLREMGYVAITAGDVNNDAPSFTVSALMYLLLTVCATVLNALSTSHALKINVHDLGIMRSMGIPAGTVRRSVYVQYALALIPVYLLTAALCAIVIFIPRLNAIFSFIPLWRYPLIAVTLPIITFYSVSRGLRRMFRGTVRISIYE